MSIFGVAYLAAYFRRDRSLGRNSRLLWKVGPRRRRTGPAHIQLSRERCAHIVPRADMDCQHLTTADAPFAIHVHIFVAVTNRPKQSSASAGEFQMRSYGPGCTVFSA